MTRSDEPEPMPDEAATVSDEDRERQLRQAIVSLAEEANVDVPDAETVEDLQERVDVLAETVETLEASLEELATSLPEERREGEGAAAATAELRADVTDLEEEVAAIREEFDEKVSDVRERVVQVLRKAESKAAADHSHPALASRLDDLDSAVTAVEDRVDGLEHDLDERTTSLETTVESQGDRVDDLEEKLTRVASAVVGIQRRVGELEANHAERESLEQLTAVANRHGITEADCENCDRTVHLGLLSAPRCPHCESHFEAVEPKSGFFGNARLAVGERPALGGEQNAPSEPEDVLEE